MKLNLTAQQRSELIERYVELVVDNMDYGSLVRFVTAELEFSFDTYDDQELKDEIENTFDGGLFDELVNNVCSEDRLTNVQH